VHARRPPGPFLNELLAPSTAVPSAPELLAPVGPSAGLLGEVAVEEVHEGGESLRVGNPEKQMIVVREKDEADKSDRLLALRPTKDAENDLVETTGGLEQKPPVNRPAGDLDQGATFGNEA